MFYNNPIVLKFAAIFFNIIKLQLVLKAFCFAARRRIKVNKLWTLRFSLIRNPDNEKFIVYPSLNITSNPDSLDYISTTE